MTGECDIIVEGFPVSLVRKPRKGLTIKITHAGEIRVLASARYPLNDIEAFVRAKRKWIDSQLAKHRGEFCLYLWGRKYGFELRQAEKCGAAVQDDRIVVYLKDMGNKALLHTTLDSWYKEQLKPKLIVLFDKWGRVMGIEGFTYHVQTMKSRWGVCLIDKKLVKISTHLAKLPESVLEETVVHELAHFYSSGHGNVFIAVMDKFLPDWRLRKAERNRMLKSVNIITTLHGIAPRG